MTILHRNRPQDIMNHISSCLSGIFFLFFLERFLGNIKRLDSIIGKSVSFLPRRSDDGFEEGVGHG